MIGAQAMKQASSAEAPGGLYFTLKGMGQTVSDHPLKVVAGAATVMKGVVKKDPVLVFGGVVYLWCTAGGPGC